ncbi:Putative electron transport protein YccM [Myxococcaceae bacterium]|jgi:cytochrome c oxidase accessory protein FixG|nr:Putative electron transport protein YccM [Myxococcaceae bacterium]
MLDARPVEGRLRTLRYAADAILIAILLVVPWLRIGGEPAVLLDVPNRKFHVFGLVIFPQELYFLWLLLAGLALTLFFATALLGRLWCGWACPQTVLTDVFAAVARRIEGWTRGGRPARVAPWRRVLLHLVWAAMALVLGFHLVAYFVPAEELLAGLRARDLSPTVAGFLATATLAAFVDLVYVRQGFCKVLCPYARFQGVLFDRDTLVIGYDALRGEPRGRRRAGASSSGDCVDCGLCVAVCPSRIDIREGLQLECIACTQCIDACDAVMEKLGRRRGLIDYRSWVGLERIRRVRIVRPRVVVYGVLLAGVGIAFAVLLGARQPLDLQVAHNATNLSMEAADGRVGNGFTLHIENRDREEHRYRLSLEGPRGFELVAGMNPLAVPAASSVEARVFVLADAGVGSAAAPTRLRFVLAQEADPEQRVAREVNFLAHPGGGRHVP